MTDIGFSNFERIKKAIEDELRKQLSLTPIEGVIDENGHFKPNIKVVDVQIENIKKFYEEFVSEQIKRPINAECVEQSADGKLTFNITISPSPIELAIIKDIKL